jgi:hypothetical protein
VRIYLYGLILARNAHLVPSHILGIRGSTLDVVSCDGLAALVSRVESASSHDLDAVRGHDHAIQSVVHHGATATAVRFGQTFADEAELRRHVGEHATTLTATLEALDGCVEMRLLMHLQPQPAPAADATSPGTAYLESLRGSNRVAGLALRGALGPIVRGERVEELPRATGVAFAHLIRREDEAEYRDSVATQPSLADATIVGPLALYAFAEGVAR